MKTMKYAMLFLFVFGFAKVWADEESSPAKPQTDGAIVMPQRDVASVAKPASDTIIDPELMNKGVWAEPYFRGPGETPRDTASDDNPDKKQEKEPEQYLDVLAKIPSSEPAISRAWVEHKAMNED